MPTGQKPTKLVQDHFFENTDNGEDSPKGAVTKIKVGSSLGKLNKTLHFVDVSHVQRWEYGEKATNCGLTPG